MRATRREISISQTFAFYLVSAHYWLFSFQNFPVLLSSGKGFAKHKPRGPRGRGGEASGRVQERSFLEGAKRKEPKPEGHAALCAPGAAPLS